MKKILVLIIFLGAATGGFAQYIAEHVSNKSIYEFLDELAAQKVIELNSAVKPYSRIFIAQKLAEADAAKAQLPQVMQKELSFYKDAYRMEMDKDTVLKWKQTFNIFKKKPHIATSTHPFGFHYKDSRMTFSIKPVYSYNWFVNANGNAYHSYGGAEAYATFKGLGIYASLRDNFVSKLFEEPTYFTQRTGAAYKKNEGDRGGADFSEMRAGITYAWKWGDVGLVKDHFVWGNNYNGSNIFSGRTPSFPHLRLHLNPVKWLDFNYVHGWLVSEVIDSAASYIDNGYRRWVYKPKYMAANMITITPFKRLNISLGNSIIYNDLGGVHAAYLIPVAFFKSMDHTVSHGIENQNSQMYIDVSSRQIKNLHLYGSLFVDEFSITRLRVKEEHNFLSWKGGFVVYNLPLKNSHFHFEFTQTTPLTFKHRINGTTFESNKYNLGHYLRDNSREVFLAFNYKPVPRLRTSISYTFAEHGNEYAYVRSAMVGKYPILDSITWKSSVVSLLAEYQFVNNCYVYVGYDISNIQTFDVEDKTAQEYMDLYTSAFFQGKTNTLRFGFNIGF